MVESGGGVCVKSERKASKSLSVSVPGPSFSSHRRNNSVTSTGSSGSVRSRSGGEDEEVMMSEGVEGQPLDLSFHKRPPTPPSTANDITQRFLFHCEVKSSGGLAYDDSQEDSDDSSDSQQPMDLGINPKAYKKSLMKRYRK